MKQLRLVFWGVVTFLLAGSILFAQDIQGNKLVSWSNASGNIRIPDGVTEIAASCFSLASSEEPDGEGLAAITSVNLNQVTTIGEYAFAGCTGLKSISAPNLKEIGVNAFRGCGSLAQLNLPAITTIDNDAWRNCEELQEVTLGAGLEKVGTMAFANCPKLTKLVAAGEAFYSANEVALVRKSDKMLVAVAGGAKEIKLDAGCTRVGVGAFFNAKGVVEIDLPEVTHVEEKAFNGCSALVRLSFPKLETIADDWMLFNGVGALSIVDVHQSPAFAGFHGNLPNKSTLTVYVANETVKALLQKELSKAKIVVGAPPADTQMVTIKYRLEGGEGRMEAWTQGAQDVPDGGEVPTGSWVRIKAYPYQGYRIASWKLGDKDVSDKVGDDNILALENLQENVDLVVTLTADARVVVFFRSLAPNMGTLRCFLPDNSEIHSADKVDAGTQLRFVAEPKKGFRITDWKEEKKNPDTGMDEFQVIPGMNGRPEYTCAATDGMDIAVDFNRKADHYIVRFKSYNESLGTLTAALADGTELVSGEAHPKGSKVIFTAHPTEGNIVSEWQVNPEEMGDDNPWAGYTELTLTIESLKRDYEVNVLCGQPSEPPTDAVIENNVLIQWQPKGAAQLPANVVAIAPQAFKGAMEMTSLALNDKVNEIGELAFLFCTALKSFSVPESNPHLMVKDGVLFSKDGKRLIAYPQGLSAQSYTIPAAVEQVQPGTFATAPALTAIAVDPANTHFTAVEGALYSADKRKLFFSSLSQEVEDPTGEGGEKKAVIAEGTESIEPLALSYRVRTKKIELPASLKRIERGGIMQCASLAMVTWAEGVIPQLEVVADSALFMARSLVAFPHIPGLKELGKGAFSTCDNMLEVHIPAGCKMGEKLFAHCAALKKVYAYDRTPQAIADDTFADIVYMDEATLFVNKGSEAAYRAATGWKRFTNITEVENLHAEVPAKELLVQHEGDNFYITGLKIGLRYRLYGIDGRLCMEGTTESDTLVVPAGQPSILLVEGYQATKLY